MFSIYNEQGRSFRNTLEELYRVEGIRSLTGVRKVASGEYEEQGAETGSPNREAINAYRQVINAKREEPIHHASQIMKRPVTTVSIDTPTADCYNLIERKGIKQFPVIDRESNPVGLITKENLLKVLIIDDGQIRHQEIDTISSITSQPMITADPVTDIRRIAKVMYDQKLNCIPITSDADIIVGIITRTDIVKAVSIHPGITLWA